MYSRFLKVLSIFLGIAIIGLSLTQCRFDDEFEFVLVMECPSDTLVFNDQVNPSITGEPVVKTNCVKSQFTLDYTDQIISSDPRVITRNWRASDECGNTAMCEQTITVNDTTSGNSIIRQIEQNMVLIEGGNFNMGCTSEQEPFCDDNEKPPFQVTLSDYKLGKYEVTQLEWREIMGTDPGELQFPGCDSCPVESISWEDAQLFISKLNELSSIKRFRIPTEAEWEYAARGGGSSQGFIYAGSNTVNEVAWYSESPGDRKTRKVGLLKENELGLYDMSGNVSEWCSDWFGEYSDSSKTDPEGPLNGITRVARGGNWQQSDGFCRVSSRLHDLPGDRNSFFGLRLAMDAPSSSIGLDCPPDITIDCTVGKEPNVTGNPIASTNCQDTILTIDYSDNPIQGECYSVLRSWIVEDLCRNYNTCEQRIIVIDTVPPDITCPPDITIYCDEDDQPSTTGLLEGVDNCALSILDISFQDSIISGPYNSLIRKWNARDFCGNDISCNQKIFKKDTSNLSVLEILDRNMVSIKGGIFFMGCHNNQEPCNLIEIPPHLVNISDFSINKFEVTQREWVEVMGRNLSLFKCDLCPVETVDWNAVQEFIGKLNQMTGENYRLPTEAEWEYAASGGVGFGDEFRYSGSNFIDSVAWYSGNTGETKPVGLKKPNGFGLYDMSGNVREWCSNYIYDYSNNYRQNPIGPDSGERRVHRGGGYKTSDRTCRIAHRLFIWENYRDSNIGFRLVKQEKESLLSFQCPTNTIFSIDMPNDTSINSLGEPILLSTNCSDPSISIIRRDLVLHRYTDSTIVQRTFFIEDNCNNSGRCDQVLHLLEENNLVIDSIRMNMVNIEGGLLEIGCTEEQIGDCSPSEIPSFQVTISPFKLSKYEVTQKEWFEVLGERPSKWGDCDNCPVEFIDYNQITRFIDSLNIITGMNYRLPTEAEWEYAARGGINTRNFKYAGSNDISEVAWFGGITGWPDRPQTIGQKKANELGIYDMSGNVAEYCFDYLGSYDDMPKIDPIGNVQDKIAVRGGAFIYSEEYCRVAYREFVGKSSKSHSTGFRLALDIQ